MLQHPHSRVSISQVPSMSNVGCLGRSLCDEQRTLSIPVAAASIIHLLLIIADLAMSSLSLATWLTLPRTAFRNFSSFLKSYHVTYVAHWLFCWMYLLFRDSTLLSLFALGLLNIFQAGLNIICHNAVSSKETFQGLDIVQKCCIKRNIFHFILMVVLFQLIFLNLSRDGGSFSAYLYIVEIFRQTGLFKNYIFQGVLYFLHNQPVLLFLSYQVSK